MRCTTTHACLRNKHGQPGRRGDSRCERLKRLLFGAVYMCV
eukprot:COSAG01_NODE_1316_length_10755_cov_4.749343_3_plen_41_part_00